KEDVRELIDATTIATQCLAALDAQESGERLRLLHQIAKRFEDSSWLADLATRMDEVQRQALLERVRSTEEVWDAITKRSIVASLLKLYPELTRA
ncbi:hypothetical protein, partial [Klebsiella pneumoniae]|uniref:hypothetical protein n=1 Tax=Klebsiella pneumoniae TaxID=573 RepID=UPI00132FB4A7